MTDRPRFSSGRARASSFGPATLLAAIAIMGGSPALAKPPTLARMFPAGAARGQTATIAAAGSFDHWPADAWVDGPGVSVEVGAEKGSLTIRVDADAEPGVRWVRLFDEEGATELRPFLVGTLPEVEEKEPNNDPERPQPVPLPAATVNGRLARSGDVDGFSVELRKGQTLVADVEANRTLGSPMDAVLQVALPSGIVLEQNDDYDGRDPRIVFRAPADGTYLVRVFAFPSMPDSSIRYAGGEAFVYRLTLTTAGFLDHAFPPAIARDASDPITLVGPDIPESARQLSIPRPADGSSMARVSHPLLAGTAEVRVVPSPVLVESEPNDLDTPQAIPDRGTICGRIDQPGDRDAFLVALKKGDKRDFRVESGALGLPLDPVLRVVDASGKALDESDDARRQRRRGGDGGGGGGGGPASRDPLLSFTAPADGDYRLLVRDLHRRGGPRFAYALRVTDAEPDFALTLAGDRYDATPGETASVKVTIDRRDGFSGPIEVVAEGLPEGLSALPKTSKPGDASAKEVTLEVVADGCSHPGPFRVVGRAVGSDLPPRSAGAPIPDSEAKTDRPWFTIRPPAEPGKDKEKEKK